MILPYTYGQYTDNTRTIHGQYTDNIRTIYALLAMDTEWIPKPRILQKRSALL